MLHNFLVLLGIRKPQFIEVLAHELNISQSNLQSAKSQVEVARAHLALYTERVKRLKKEMEEITKSNGDTQY